MKFIFFILTAMFFSCNSTENKAEKSVKNYIIENINDPKSYEPIRFGELRNDSTNVDDDIAFQSLKDSSDYYEEKYKDVKRSWLLNNISYNTYGKLSLSYAKKRKEYADSLLNFLNHYEPQPNGFLIMHTFRKRNSKGALIIDSMAFRLDSNYNIKIKNYYHFLNDDEGANRFSHN